MKLTPYFYHEHGRLHTPEESQFLQQNYKQIDRNNKNKKFSSFWTYKETNFYERNWLLLDSFEELHDKRTRLVTSAFLSIKWLHVAW